MRTLLILTVLMAGCGGSVPAPSDPVSGPLEKRFLEIARDYESYGRVDDETRWAPYLCRQPMPGRARVSAPAGAHGQKLYSLFARFRKDYVDGKTQPEGQVLVKESWMPQEVPEAEATRAFSAAEAGRCRKFPWIPYASRDGKVYRATERAGLFIMVKGGGPDTDEGWVYGTISPEGKLTSAGRVASCMSCHQDAKVDRIFGIRWSE